MAVRRVSIFLSHGDQESLRLAGSCALASAAMGDRVDVFLFGEAVNAVVAASQESEGSAKLLYQARVAGECRLFACSQSLVAGGMDPHATDSVLDAIIGWPSIIEWSRGVVDRFFF